MVLVRKNVYDVDSSMYLIEFMLQATNFLHTSSGVEFLLSQGRILYNEAICKENVLLKPGDKITLLTPQSLEPAVSQNIELLYEDEYFFAVSKPSQLPVHPSGKYFFNTLSSLVGRKLGLCGLYPYNRLDRETSGIVLFAKDKKFVQLLQNISIDKCYLAVVFGAVSPALGVIDKPLAQKTVGELRHHMVVDPNGKPCFTEYEVVSANGAYSLVRLKLLTGRKHQIRAHLSSFGHPIVGDKQYGAFPDLLISYSANERNEEDILKKVKALRQLLHCYRVVFRHPKKNKMVVIGDSIKDYFLEFLKKEKLDLFTY